MIVRMIQSFGLQILAASCGTKTEVYIDEKNPTALHYTGDTRKQDAVQQLFDEEMSQYAFGAVTEYMRYVKQRGLLVPDKKIILLDNEKPRF